VCSTLRDSAISDDAINYQEPGYCGVPVHKPNQNLFLDLPRSSKSKTSDSRYQMNSGRVGQTSSTNEGPTNRLPVGGPRIQHTYGRGPSPYNFDPELYQDAPQTGPTPPTPSPPSYVLRIYIYFVRDPNLRF